MSTSEIYPLLWDRTLAVGPALLKFIPKLVDLAIARGLHCSLDEFGCAYILFTPGDFLIRFGVHPQRRPDMGLAAGNNVELTNWRFTNDKKEAQLQVEHFIRNTILYNVSEELQRPMQDEDGSMRARTAEYIISTLIARHGTLTKADIDLIMTKLDIPHIAGSDVSVFIADWELLLRDLRRARQPLSQHQAIDKMQKCFGSSFADCWVKFVQDFPVVADRTVTLLGVAIVAFAKDVLPLKESQMAIGINQVISQTAILLKMQDQIDVLTQALAVEKAHPADRKRGALPPPARAVKHKKPDRTLPLSARLFCWTHGPCDTHTGEVGCCTNPLPGHKELATWKNQMGSQWKAMYERRGWPIV